MQLTQAPVVPAKKSRPAIPLILIGLLLLLVALHAPAALLFGVGATGVITDVRQIVDGSSERMDYNFRITYTFTTPDGKSHSGSYDMNRVYNSANLPAEGAVKNIKYLPGMPFINCLSGQSNIGLASVILLLLGAFLLILGISGGGGIIFQRTGRRP